MATEADTCRTHVVPALYAAGWSDDQIAEQHYFTAGRIIVAGERATRGRRKFADYLLRFRRDVPLAVVEAKAAHRHAADGLEQAKAYAGILGVPFAYATNGPEIVEFDALTGLTTPVVAYPSPDRLWERFRAGKGLGADAAVAPLLEPDHQAGGNVPRYYQRIAINRAVQAVARGHRRVLLTMATGTGKTTVAFQICWKLFKARWNLTGAPRQPRILFLADRDILVGDPMAKDFAPFGDARSRIQQANVTLGRSMYFATYQALAGDETRRPLFERYARDFFDLIVVDECHRGSARDDSVWREILTYFHPAAQIGMTATPLRDETRDSYRYFGTPVYTYSLRDGIADGFLAPYRVHRVISDVDAAGWRPSAGDLDRYGREIPDAEYGTKDFERAVALKARTDAIAGHLSRFMDETDPLAKTIVFCVDQEHAAEMAQALGNRSPQLMQIHPDYVARVTADEGDVGRGHLAHFQDIERTTPTILTTSQLLTTGVDAPTCKNIVLARVVGSMTEFKQIIGRGTRVREDCGKLTFNILDYTGSATRLFADPDFDGDPVIVTQEEIDRDGLPTGDPTTLIENPPAEQQEGETGIGERETTGGYDADGGGGDGGPRKFYVDNGEVRIIHHLVYELDADGAQLRVVQLTDYTGEKVRALVPSAADLRAAWVDPARRQEILDALAERGLTPEAIAAATGHPEADTFDLLCHLAFNAPLRTRRERAERLAAHRDDFFDRYGPEARAILGELVEKYAVHGVAQLRFPDVLKVPPLSAHGNVTEIAAIFGGAQHLRDAFADFQTLLYDADAEPDAA